MNIREEINFRISQYKRICRGNPDFISKGNFARRTLEGFVQLEKIIEEGRSLTMNEIGIFNSITLSSGMNIFRDYLKGSLSKEDAIFNLRIAEEDARCYLKEKKYDSLAD